MHIIFILKDGTHKNAEFEPGETILQAAMRADIILNSRCEGNGVCGSCHVLIKHQDNLSDITKKEEAGIDNARNVTINSRLACQVVLTEANDRLEITIPQ